MVLVDVVLCEHFVTVGAPGFDAADATPGMHASIIARIVITAIVLIFFIGCLP